MTQSHLLTGLMKWAGRDPWREALADRLERHLGPACDDAGVGANDLADLIGEDWLATLWGCAFEDLVSRTLEDGRNLADDYLKRRGWNEPVPTRAYIAALGASRPSLYEVSAIVVGEGFLARDLIAGGEPVRVFEKSATKSLAQWDRIATRVLTVGTKTQISGGVLKFDPNASEEVLAAIRPYAKAARKTVPGQNDLPATLSNIWLKAALASVLNPVQPVITNTDGDVLEFVTVRFSLASSTKPSQVRTALTSVAEMQAENGTFWNWVERTPAKRKPTKSSIGTQSFATALDDGSVVLGTIELKGRTLTLSTNSQARAASGRALIEPLLAGLLLAPVVECQTIEQARVARRIESQPAAEVPLEVARPLVHRTLTDHYTRMLDEPVPALGNVTPRKAARTAKGREKVIAWLKMMENHHAQMPTDDPMADYDFGWLWNELGLSAWRR